jgi:beta-glucosidase
MTKATYNFPRDFLWGTATASYQVEGNNTNCNWYAWEEAGKIINGQRSKLACDWWGGRWREDFDLAASGGQNAHRLSIEWSRVQPAPDRWDEEAIDKYREIVRGLNERGLTPIVTLHHFTEPLWITEIGGWEREDILEPFKTYVQKIVEALKEYTDLWITINEPNVLTISSYILGDFPPGKKNLLTAANVATNLVRAHALAYQTIHQLQPAARVGVAHNYHAMEPKRLWSPFDRLATNQVFSLLNELFPNAFIDGIVRFPIRHIRIPEAKGTQDFFGLNYYTKEYLAFDLLKPKQVFIQRSHAPQAELGDTAFIANEPDGFFEAIKWGRKYNLPIIITENGVENADDSLRPRYIAQHIHQLWRAVNFNWPIRGYFHWTLVDNFEWERGWTQRFGLWELDVDTQTRRKRPSADLYTDICVENGLSSEMVAKYAPQVLAKIFPQ